MVAKEINDFIEIVGKDSYWSLFCDNAISLYGSYKNGHIYIDESNEMIHYFSPSGNSLEDSKDVEYLEVHTEMVQYALVRLSRNEALAVIDKLKARGDVPEEFVAEFKNDTLFYGDRQRIKSTAYDVVEVN